MSHGLRNLPDTCLRVIDSLKHSDRLFIQYDSLALALRIGNPTMLVGYCPRYHVKDFNRILEKSDPGIIKVFVDRLNKDAPLSLRSLCKIVAPWPEHFEPLMDEEYATIAQD